MLEIKDLYKSYNKKFILKNININVKKNSSLALIGESGAGKTTLSKLILNIEKPTKGQINIREKKVNVVFQDYRSSVNPTFNIDEILKEPFWSTNIKFDKKELGNLLQIFNLPNTILDKYPHQLSGGQLQRVCILRAILSKPDFLILDEAFNALDIYTKAKIVSFLKEQKDLTLFLITHDLEIAVTLCEDIKILYKGDIIESLKSNSLKNVKHPYTKMLIDSIMKLEK
ncbi:MAG: ATP-binding cassette domain-containing protein [Campylobacteraceae bacterium]|nr:ATP-binding cassette domain-containing protein [Campylobacteraceae bacterium]